MDYFQEHKLLDPFLVQGRIHRMTMSTPVAKNPIIINLKVISQVEDGFRREYLIMLLEF